MNSPPPTFQLPPPPPAPRPNRTAPTQAGPISPPAVRRPLPLVLPEAAPAFTRRNLEATFQRHPPPSSDDELYEKAVQTLMKQLYGMPVELPQYLIVNNIRVEFIPFTEIPSLLREIERSDLNPLLQPWAGHPNQPNRIVTLFMKDGTTSLVKARYDKSSEQIFPPV